MKLGLSENVTILGGGNGLSFDEILKYYKVTNVFVLPSINAESGDADGVPNVLIEAAFLKIPVITTDAGGILDFVEDKTSGVIVEQKNPQQLADAISQVLKNKKLQNTLTENAYENAVKMFDLNKNIKEIERLLV